jgi:hypothetical protein
MKKEKMLKIGVYGVGLCVGAFVGVETSKLLFNDTSPVILGAVGATVFSNLVVDFIYQKKEEDTSNFKNEINSPKRKMK